MRILLTNDDGIHAEGILALSRALKKTGDVTVAAPDGERSSVGHAITLAHPLWVREVHKGKAFLGYGISGTPADCVKCAVGELMKVKPDLVVSGINLGGNEGCSVFYSGTVAGAREGALMGIPAVAFSLAAFDQPHFKDAARVAARMVRQMARRGLPRGVFLNVNIPNLPERQIKGTLATRQALAPIHGTFHQRRTPDGREYYWMSGKNPPVTGDLTVDVNALHKGYITVTPVLCDVTDHAFLQDLKTWSF